jgi:hypothetical protein
MFTQLLVIMAIMAVAFAADPAIPTLPAQYSVEDISMHMETNAGYPPKYTETDSAQYSDFEKKMTRLDVKEASYGAKGPYSKIYNYNELFSNNCGKQYPDVQAPRGYMVQGTSCCYANLVNGCPYNPTSGEIPSAQMMSAPEMPKKIVYGGVVDAEGIIPAGKTADKWVYDIFLGQEVPVIHTDYYFDSTDHETQLGNFFNINAGPQFVNATTTYNGKWVLGPQDAELFDLSGYDCSYECKSEVTHAMHLSAKAHQKHN